MIAVVRQGADVKFRCTSKDAPDTNVLHAYLCKNQRITDVNLWDSVRKQAYFPIRRVQVQDSSNYSCVLSQKLLAPTDLGMCGSNTLYLKANGENNNMDMEIPCQMNFCFGWKELGKHCSALQFSS